jgi:hypothetical protein
MFRSQIVRDVNFWLCLESLMFYFTCLVELLEASINPPKAAGGLLSNAEII